jgi:hypothetical protein
MKYFCIERYFSDGKVYDDSLLVGGTAAAQRVSAEWLRTNGIGAEVRVCRISKEEWYASEERELEPAGATR